MVRMTIGSFPAARAFSGSRQVQHRVSASTSAVILVFIFLLLIDTAAATVPPNIPVP